MHWLSKWAWSQPGRAESVEWPSGVAGWKANSRIPDAQYKHFFRFGWPQYSRLHVRRAPACQLEDLSSETGLQHYAKRGSPAVLSWQFAGRQDATGSGIPWITSKPGAHQQQQGDCRRIHSTAQPKHHQQPPIRFRAARVGSGGIEPVLLRRLLERVGYPLLRAYGKCERAR